MTQCVCSVQFGLCVCFKSCCGIDFELASEIIDCCSLEFAFAFQSIDTVAIRCRFDCKVSPSKPRTHRLKEASRATTHHGSNYDAWFFNKAYDVSFQEACVIICLILFVHTATQQTMATGRPTSFFNEVCDEQITIYFGQFAQQKYETNCDA